VPRVPHTNAVSNTSGYLGLSLRLGSIDPTICSFSCKFRHRPGGIASRLTNLI
jgi:hypothetical protein